MNTLRKALVSPPVSVLPNSTGHKTFGTDACDKHTGSVVLQKQEDETRRPIGYWSHSLNHAEKTYDTTQRKCLSTVWSVLMLRLYLERTRFAIRTDHDSLKWTLNLTDNTGRLARWCLCLSEHDFDVVHRTGIKL